jgi:hypothetical protein
MQAVVRRAVVPKITGALLLASSAVVSAPACLPKPAPPAAAGAASDARAQLSLPASTSPAHATIEVDRSRVLRKFDKRLLLGSNIAIWHQAKTFEDPKVSEAFVDAGIGLLRMPGGSAADQYFWNGNGVRQGNDVERSKYNGTSHRWAIDYSSFKPGFNGFWGFPKDPKTAELPSFHGNVDVQQQLDFITRAKSQALITVNAGTGTAKDAAEWVRWANKKMSYQVRYWEIGNELGGGWESGTLRPDGKTMDGAIYGGIYSEFARAMKAVDSSIWVGSQGGVDFIRGALARKEAPMDFVTFHDYYNADGPSIEARFKTLDRIQGQIADVKRAIEELRPKSDIKIGMTEYNCKLFEDEETSDVLSGLWTIAAVGEMLYGGLDFATQWDTFTQKRQQGGGHGFMLEDGAVPKAEYWSFYLLSRYLGDSLLAVKDSAPELRTYASKDESGNLYLVVVNTDPAKAVLGEISLGDVPVASVAEGMRFSYHEYSWDPQAFTPLYNGGPSRFQVRVASKFEHEFPAFSATALRIAAPAKASMLSLEGDQKLVLSAGSERPLQVSAFDAEGKPAAGVNVSAVLEGAGFQVTPAAVATDASGRASFVLKALAGPAAAVLGLSAASFPASKYEVSSVSPELLIHGADRAAANEVVSYFGALRYPKTPGYELLQSFSGPGGLRIGDSEEHALQFDRGLARFDLSLGRAGKHVLTLSAGQLSQQKSLDVFDTELQEIVALNFDSDQALANTSGKLKFSVNQNVRANQGVLQLDIPGVKGWTQDAVSFDKLQDTAGLDREHIVALSLDIMPGPNLDTSNDWAALVLVLQSELNYWMPLEAIDLRKLPPGQWTHVKLEIKEEQLKAMKALFKIVSVVNSGGSVSGLLYLDNLAFTVKAQKKEESGH